MHTDGVGLRLDSRDADKCPSGTMQRDDQEFKGTQIVGGPGLQRIPHCLLRYRNLPATFWEATFFDSDVFDIRTGSGFKTESTFLSCGRTSDFDAKLMLGRMPARCGLLGKKTNTNNRLTRRATTEYTAPVRLAEILTIFASFLFRVFDFRRYDFNFLRTQSYSS